jgi:hypothetical protein
MTLAPLVQFEPVNGGAKSCRSRGQPGSPNTLLPPAEKGKRDGEVDCAGEWSEDNMPDSSKWAVAQFPPTTVRADNHLNEGMETGEPVSIAAPSSALARMAKHDSIAPLIHQYSALILLNLCLLYNEK